jgi:hypothetical protein
LLLVDAMVGDKARELFDQRAKDRQKLSKGRGKKGKVTLPYLNDGQSRDEAGKAVGVSGTLIDRAKDRQKVSRSNQGAR